jgi:hypothetical protein
MITEEQITTCVNKIASSALHNMKFTALRNWGGCPVPASVHAGCGSIIPGSRPLGMSCQLRKITVLDPGACIVETPCRRIQEYFKLKEAK